LPALIRNEDSGDWLTMSVLKFATVFLFAMVLGELLCMWVFDRRFGATGWFDIVLGGLMVLASIRVVLGHRIGHE
jgi:steroid 5-alpha reductase family enzyme